MRFVQFYALPTLFLAPSAKADWVFNLTPGVTPSSHDIYDLHMTVFWVCVAIGVVVFGVLFYAIIHHRKSKGVKPAQFHEHLWVELTWTAIPFIILVALAIPASNVLIHMRDTAESDLTIKITGFQWKWQYEYIDKGIHFFSNSTTPFDQIHNKVTKDVNYLRTVDHPLVLPIHKKVRLLITSNDVIHSWWVPDLGTKQDAIPGYINEAWTRIQRPGTYHGQCAELCGINHAYMPIVVIAMAGKDYDNWVAEQLGGGVGAAPSAVAQPPVTTAPSTVAKPPAATTPSTQANTPTAKTSGQTFTLEQQMAQGEKIFNGTCAVCHQSTGEGMPPVYPALKGSKIVTGPLPNHLNRVLFGKMGTAMQAFKDQFSDEELAAVITFERNSWGNKGTAVEPSDVAAEKAKGPLPE